MARQQSLASMSVDLLLKMRDDVTAAITQKAGALKKELAAMGHDYAEVGRIAVYGRKKKSRLAGRKVAPKYRDPKSKVTWAGRGAQPLWLRDALKKGKKLEHFLIEKPAAARNPKAKKALKKAKVIRKSKKQAAAPLGATAA